MTDLPGSCGPPSVLDRAVTAFQSYAFRALLAEDAPREAQVAETASRDTVGVVRAVAWLDAHGRLERDGDLLVGAQASPDASPPTRSSSASGACTPGVPTTPWPSASRAR